MVGALGTIKYHKEMLRYIQIYSDSVGFIKPSTLLRTSLVKMALAELMPHFPSRAERHRDQRGSSGVTARPGRPRVESK